MQTHPLMLDIYRLIQSLPRMDATTPRRDWPLNGIYVVFEDGETVALDGAVTGRVVRVGSHTNAGRCGKRIRQHYGHINSLAGNKNGSVFRKHVGAALLRRTNPQDPRLTEWLRPMGRSDPEVETHVSQYLREHVQFRWVRVDDAAERLALETALIALFAQHPLGQPSTAWLGRHAVSENVRRAGLWNSRDIDAAPLTALQFARFTQLVEITCSGTSAPIQPVPATQARVQHVAQRGAPPRPGTTRRQPAFAESYRDVVANVEQFNRDLRSRHDVVSQLSMFRHWYYIPELDAFGPSKYIGYKDMNAERYARGEDKDGRDTEVLLRHWFTVLEEHDTRLPKLARQLEQLLMRYNRQPKRNFRIHVPH